MGRATLARLLTVFSLLFWVLNASPAWSQQPEGASKAPAQPAAAGAKKTEAKDEGWPKEPGELVFGYLSRGVVVEEFKELKPLVDYLRKATGMKIQLRTGFTFDKVFDNIKNGYYDFAYVATTQYVKIKKTVDVQLVGMTTKDGKEKFSAVVVVRKDSGINAIADLKGKTFLTTKGGLAVHPAPMDLMEKNGLNPKTDIKIKFGSAPINCLMDVADRKADVTAVPKGLWAKAEKMVKKEDLKVVGETEPVPQLPIIARPGLDPELAKKVQDALFALKPGHPDYEAVYKHNQNFNGVVPTQDSEFDQTRRLMAKWMDEPFPGMPAGKSTKTGRKK
ncbi:MAG: phosphate/phosphite/phosphonate ABC transporter substrate-binding protein [Nitrospirae bacterium]|nr:phosphate/phosphite/phosphonate ABC transporter substrate-binding protein [Nitrospirota bacterium]